MSRGNVETRAAVRGETGLGAMLKRTTVCLSLGLAACVPVPPDPGPGLSITTNPALFPAFQTGIADYVAVIRPTGVQGTPVAGVQTTPTATTGDVRGTSNHTYIGNRDFIFYEYPSGGTGGGSIPGYLTGINENLDAMSGTTIATSRGPSANASATARCPAPATRKIHGVACNST
mgnify:CR=1 FL=1